MVSGKSWSYLNLYGHYKNGTLLRGGGLVEQPNKYLEAMELIDGYT